MSRPRFEALKSRPKRHALGDLLDYFDQLEPVALDRITGSWKGGIFATGHPTELLLKDFKLLKWHGKRFESPDRVQALVGRCLGFEMSFPFGQAVLRRVEFRDKVSTAMIYDRRPIIDHFRRIDEDALMGVMDQKGKIVLCFYLERE